MTMNKRTVEIVHQIISSTSRKLQLKQLAEKFDVSERTIRNDIDRINQYFGEELISLGIEGSLLLDEKIRPRDIRDQIAKIDFYEYGLSKEERVSLNVCLLSLTKDYITYEQIGDLMYISRYTVINDFVEVEKLLKDFNIKIESLSNKGIKLVGQEEDIRQNIIKIITTNTKLVGNLLRQKKLFKIINLDNREIQEELEIIGKIIKESENENKLYLTDISIERLTYYLYFVITRVRSGKKLEFIEITQIENKTLSVGILEKVSQYFELYIDGTEINELEKFLMKLNYIKKEINNPDILKIQTLTRKFIEAVSKSLDINLNNDYIFFKSLSDHLERLFREDNTKYPEFFGMNSIIEKNQEVLNAVKDNKVILEGYSKKTLTLEDIKYISIYICVSIEKKKNKVKDIFVLIICNSGISTSQFLKEQLKKYFDFISVKVLSYYEFKETELEYVDLIISTVELQDMDLDYVLISPIFSLQEAITVDRKLDEIKLKRIKGTQKQKPKFIIPQENHFKEALKLSQLLTIDKIKVGIEANDWKDAILKASKILEDNGDIENEYTRAIIENIEENGPYIVIAKGFALPHGRYDQGVNRLSMSLLRLERPVNFGMEELDPIDFICVLSTIDNKAHLKALFTLVNILKMEGFYSELMEGKSEENLYKTIKKYEEKYIKTNNWR